MSHPLSCVRRWHGTARLYLSAWLGYSPVLFPQVAASLLPRVPEGIRLCAPSTTTNVGTLSSSPSSLLSACTHASLTRVHSISRTALIASSRADLSGSAGRSITSSRFGGEVAGGIA